jgi:hypothetical protein
MGCACIHITSKQLLVKSNCIINSKEKEIFNQKGIQIKIDKDKDKDKDKENTSMNKLNKSQNNNIKKIIPILWLTIVDFLDQKDLKETRKINR